MATATDVKGTKGYCDKVYTELISMRNRLAEMKNMTIKEGAENEVIGIFEKHLDEIVDEFDWKIQVLAHICPYDWKGSADYEANVQVEQREELRSSTFSPGYTGG